MNIRPGLYVLLLASILSGCNKGPRVSYHQEVYPVFQRNCFACHIPPQGAGYLKTGLDLTTYASLMQGSVYGPVIKPGDSGQGSLNMLVEGRAAASMRMPHDRNHPLTEQEIEILHLWVDQVARNT